MWILNITKEEATDSQYCTNPFETLNYQNKHKQLLLSFQEEKVSGYFVIDLHYVYLC